MPNRGSFWAPSAHAEPGVGHGYTYSTENPHARLDYVMHSKDVMPRAAAVLSTDGSDHLPVIADVALPGDWVGAGIPVRPTHG